MSPGNMADKVSMSVVSKRSYRPISVMEAALKELYKNAEEKLPCVCLVHKDMRAIVIEYFHQQKPWLIESEVKRRADVLLKTCYEEYKKERNSTMNVIRRSFRKAARKEPSCGCCTNNANFMTKLYRKNSNYKELEESIDEENCNCHVTCSAQYKPDNFLRSLDCFVATNRSFKLKLKHLDQEKYGHLITDNPGKKTKAEPEENITLTTPNKSFRVNVEDASTPNSKIPQYRLHYMLKSPMVAEKFLDASCKNEKFASASKKHEATQNKIGTCCGHTGKKPEAKNGTATRKSQREVKSMEQADNEVVVKFSHCDSHCFLCAMEKDSTVEPQLVYCRDHCPKCVLESKQGAEIVKPSIASNENNSKKTTLKRSKSENRPAKIVKTRPFFKDDTSLLDSSVESHVRKENVKRKSNGKENTNNFLVDDGIFVLEKNMDELNLTIEDYLEWDSMGLELSPKKIGSKRITNWSNTSGVFDNIKNNHINPIKRDLKYMQNYFKQLKHKYKY